jgi:hypothetical protein
MEMQEKLFQSRQIYDLMYSAVSFVQRLGLPQAVQVGWYKSTNTDAAAGTNVQALTQLPVQEIFDQDESCDFETFMELTEEALQEMGVDNFGAR